MTFALAGQTITQSGIDTDATTISGLSAIAGVTTIAESGRTRLIIPLKLSITGVMTNTSAVAFTFSRVGSPANEVVITSTGRWNYKESRTVNGLTDWRIMPPLIFTQTVNNGYNGTASNLIYLVGGTIDFAKVEIIGNGGQYYQGGSVIFREVIINAEGLASANDNQITTQVGNPNLDIDGLEIRGASMFLKGAVITQLKRLKPKFVSRGYGGGFGEQNTLQDYDCNGAVFDLAIYANGVKSALRSNNGVKGGGVTCGPWNAPSNFTNEYYCTADLVLTGVNEIGSAVAFKTYHLDNNTGAPAGSGVTATNYTLRKTYNAAATAGGVATLNVLLAAGLNDNAMVRRSVSQTDDLFIFNLFSYLSQPTLTPSINLAGAGIKAATVVQLSDGNISQSTKAIVDAYVMIDSLDQLYDRAKAYLFDSYAGETTLLATASGTVIDLGARNLVIDATAAAAFAATATAITIKSAALAAGAKFKSLKTTGTVTVLNGGSITAPYVDSTQSGLIGVIGAAAANTIEMRRVDNDVVLASRTGSGNLSVSPANIGVSAYFVRLDGTTIIMSTKTTPTLLASGVNADVPLYAGAQVQVAQAAILETIPAKLTVINDGVKKASLIIPHTDNLP